MRPALHHTNNYAHSYKHITFLAIYSIKIKNHPDAYFRFESILFHGGHDVAGNLLFVYRNLLLRLAGKGVEWKQNVYRELSINVQLNRMPRLTKKFEFWRARLKQWQLYVT